MNQTTYPNCITAMKFNRKVCIVPFEKFNTEQTTRDFTPLNDKHESEQRMEETVSHLFDKHTEQYRNSMALVYILKLDPISKKSDRDFLIFTQREGSLPPKDIISIYHDLDIAEVPSSLISNKGLVKSLNRLRRLKEEEEEEEDDSYDDDDDDDVNYSAREVDAMRKAWLAHSKGNYIKQHSKHNINAKRKVSDPSKKTVVKKGKTDNKRNQERQEQKDWINLF